MSLQHRGKEADLWVQVGELRNHAMLSSGAGLQRERHAGFADFGAGIWAARRLSTPLRELGRNGPRETVRLFHPAGDGHGAQQLPWSRRLSCLVVWRNRLNQSGVSRQMRRMSCATPISGNSHASTGGPGSWCQMAGRIKHHYSAGWHRARRRIGW